jgi:hypothetical protein
MALPVETKDGSSLGDYTKISGERPHQCKAMLPGPRCAQGENAAPKSKRKPPFSVPRTPKMWIEGLDVREKLIRRIGKNASDVFPCSERFSAHI